MRSQSIIQRFFAAVLLLVFAFSITPKKYLHELVADHKDFYSYHSGEETTVNTAGFNCHCEELVVSTPFVETSLETALLPTIVYRTFSTSSYHFFFYSTNSAKDSRGPPSLS
ncbi:MAG: hypothetical protein WKF70_06145 [Chitinophagaceae bacterium]